MKNEAVRKDDEVRKDSGIVVIVVCVCVCVCVCAGRGTRPKVKLVLSRSLVHSAAVCISANKDTTT
jgi:hypothetical protein